MSILVTCEACGGELHLNDRLAGRKVRCQHCDAVVHVPQTESVPATAVARSAGAKSETDNGSLDSAQVDGQASDAQTLGAALNRGEVDAIEPETHEPSGRDRVEFAHDPVFDSPGHHHATDMPSLPPSLQAEDGEDDPPKRAKRKEDELDMTPMVDVTFLLLIFFMVTASFSLQKSMSMPRQQSDLPSSAPIEEPPEEPDMVTVQIDEFGSFLVLASDWERETPGKQNLISALREAIAPFGGAVTLSIEVHEEAKLRYLVDCMDAGAICSFAEVKITQVEGFD
jgi:biopolymer transport protein ExbD